jgi:hypothetical protein
MNGAGSPLSLSKADAHSSPKVLLVALLVAQVLRPAVIFKADKSVCSTLESRRHTREPALQGVAAPHWRVGNLM